MKKSVSNIASEVQNQINFLDYKSKDLQKLLNANFIENIAHVCEDLYTSKYKIEEFKYHLLYLNNPNHSTKSDQDKVNDIIGGYDRMLARGGNVRARSTNPLTSEVSTWIYLANLELRNFFQKLVENDYKVHPIE